MAISFPLNPMLNDTYVYNSITWTYNGTSWSKAGAGGGGTASAAGVSDQANSSTGYFDLPGGTTAQRPATPATGNIRYNSTTGFAEVYTSAGWGAFGAQPPSISSVTPGSFNGEQGTAFTINGSDFTADAIVKFVDAALGEWSATIVSFVSSTQLTATTPKDFTIADEPLSVKVAQASGQVTKPSAIDCGGTPTWSTASGSLATLTDTARTITTTVGPVVATDPDSGATITYSVYSGALPSGISLNSSTGELTGTAAAVVTNTTYNFTIRASDNAGNTTDRAFSITVNAPVTTVYSYTGANQTFTVPAGVNYVKFKLWGAGGSGNSTAGGNGGFTQTTIATTPGTVYTLIVGQAKFLQNATIGYGGGASSYSDGGAGGGDGGGRTAVRLAAGTEIITAGGGGGGGYSSGLGGGAGGGLTGVGVTGAGGGGGTQSAGGAGGTGNGGTATSGSQYTGGPGTGGWAGGGGGGGYYGGGGGGGTDNSHMGGGGGSGWVGRNGSTILTGNEYGSVVTPLDPSGRTDTVTSTTYYNTVCIRGNNAGDANWGSSAGTGALTTSAGPGRLVVIY